MPALFHFLLQYNVLSCLYPSKASMRVIFIIEISSEKEDMRTEPGRIDAILRLPSTSARGSSPRRVRPAAPP